MEMHRQTSSISHNKSQNLHVSRFALELSLRNLLQPGMKTI